MVLKIWAAFLGGEGLNRFYLFVLWQMSIELRIEQMASNLR